MWASNQTNVQKTVDCVAFLAKTVGDKINILEVMNEPAGFLGDSFTSVLRQYYIDAYDAIRAANGNDTGVMLSDGFRGLDVSNSTDIRPQALDSIHSTVLGRLLQCSSIPANVDGHGMRPVLPDFRTIADRSLSKHVYQIFSDLELSRSFDQHISYACNQSQSFVEFESSNIWTVLGEWSNALTDCALWLNGRGVGARWEGKWGTAANQQVFGSCDGYTGDSSTFSDEYKAQLREYFEVQIEIGEMVQGWVFWTWKVRRRFRVSLGTVDRNMHHRPRTRMNGVIAKE